MQRLERFLDAERSGLISAFTNPPMISGILGVATSGLAKLLDIDMEIDSLELAVSNDSSLDGTKVESLSSESYDKLSLSSSESCLVKKCFL